MAVRSRRVLGPESHTSASSTLLYTVPSGRTLVIRTVTLTYNGAGGAAWRLCVNGAATTDAIRRGTFAAAGEMVLEAWLALNPGDELRLAGITAGHTINVAVFGALLEGEPE